jgi:protein-L-isoaspartate(D-aspartate) O-methyltransferase
LPLPGTAASISCPHSYPLFYEPLGLGLGHRFLEIGTGSGYGAAVAREVVGDGGQVTSIEIDPLTYAFARQNLERTGYADIVLVLGDGGLEYTPRAPYDRIAVTAACAEIAPPLVAQLSYQPQRLITTGGMGKVWQGINFLLGRAVEDFT